MIEVELPDGRVLEIGTTDRAVAASAAKRFLQREQAGSQASNFSAKSNPIQQDEGLKRKGNFLPYSTDLQTGKTSFDPTAGFIGAAIDGFTLPGDVATGKAQVFDGSGNVAPDVVDRSLAAAALTPAGRALGASTSGISPTARSMIRRRAKDIPDAAFDDAIVLQRSAERANVPLLGPEAIESEGLRQLASATQQTRTGGPVMDNALRGRSEAVEALARGEIDNVALPGGTPKQVAQDTGDAAQGVLNEAGRFRASQTKPFFKAAEGEDITPSELSPVFQALDNIRTDSRSGAAGAIRELKTRLTREDGSIETNAAVLDGVYKDFRDRVDINFRTASSDEKGMAAQLKPAVRALKRALESSENIRKGRETHRQISQQLNEPLERGDIGQLANKPTFKKIRQTLLDPDTARPNETYSTLRLLADEAPELPERITRIHLENVLDKSLKQTQGGKVNAGPKFSQALAGTPQKRALITSMFRALEEQRGIERGTLSRGFFNSLKILDRTGRVPGVGSQTQPRQLIADEAAEGGRAAAVAGALNITKGSAIGQAQTRLREWVQAETYEDLARVFTNPDSVALIRQIARRKNPGSPKSIANLAVLLAAGQQQSNADRKSDRNLLPNEA